VKVHRGEGAVFLGMSFSPASDLLAWDRLDGSFADGDFNIHVGASNGDGDAQSLTQDGASLSPLWSPDGFIAYSRLRPNGLPTHPRYQLWRMNPDGAGRERVSELDLEAHTWSRDGTRLLATMSTVVGVYPYVVSAGSWQVRRLPVRDVDMGTGGLSSDGALVLATWYRGGKPVVGVITWDGRGRRILVRGAVTPHWNW
jgi:hypothetical protein